MGDLLLNPELWPRSVRPTMLPETLVPHRLSLVRRLAELRRLYTGETDSSLMPAVTGGMQQLDADDRLKITETLDNDYICRLLGENELPPPAARIRQALMPDAHCDAQRELELAIAVAASRIGDYVRLRPPANPVRPVRVFRMVRPQQDTLVLHLEAAALGPLLLEMVPRVTDGVLVGMPGLRARLCRRHIEVYLVDSDPAAVVSLANVSYRQWCAALAFAEAVDPDTEQWWLGNDPQPLTAHEVQALAEHDRAPGAARLTSAVLRRGRLFTGESWITFRRNGCGDVCLEWTDNPSLPWVAAKLLHPVFGRPCLP